MEKLRSYFIVPKLQRGTTTSKQGLVILLPRVLLLLQCQIILQYWTLKVKPVALIEVGGNSAHRIKPFSLVIFVP